MATRRRFFKYALAITGSLLAGCRAETDKAAVPSYVENTGVGAIPVILDTDIGDDIDDTWALFMLLRMPQLELKLSVGDSGNAIYRGRLLAKLLQQTGRTDVSIGIGVDEADEPGRQSDWV